MEGKNALLAIIFSTLVLVVWAVFFEPPVTEKQIAQKQITQNQELSTPSIDEKESFELLIPRSKYLNVLSTSSF